MRILLDTNIVLDLLPEREPWRAEAVAIAEAAFEGHIFAPTDDDHPITHAREFRAWSSAVGRLRVPMFAEAGFRVLRGG